MKNLCKKAAEEKEIHIKRLGRLADQSQRISTQDRDRAARDDLDLRVLIQFPEAGRLHQRLSHAIQAEAHKGCEQTDRMRDSRHAQLEQPLQQRRHRLGVFH